MWASHSNCRSLVPHNRQFSDDHIRELVQREAVIGVAFDAWMLYPDGCAVRPRRRRPVSRSRRDRSHRPHLPARRERPAVGIGSDLDGAFGTEQCPSDVETIADLSKLPALLARAATASRTSSRSLTATSSGSCNRRGARPPRSALYVRKSETDSRSVSMTAASAGTAQHFHSATGHG